MSSETPRKLQGRFGPKEVALLGMGTALLTALLTFLSVRMSGRSATVAPEMSMALIIHLATVIPALPLGAYVIIRRKGDIFHRSLGRTWCGLMMITALSSFWVRDISQHLSFIHIFSVTTLVAIPWGIYRISKGDIDGHGRTMTGIYIGLVVAGLFAFLPNRLMGDWLWP